MSDYVTVFGEYYLRENDAILAAVHLATRNPGNNYGVRYDCVEDLYRVVLIIGKTEEPLETLEDSNGRVIQVRGVDGRWRNV